MEYANKYTSQEREEGYVPIAYVVLHRKCGGKAIRRMDFTGFCTDAFDICKDKMDEEWAEEIKILWSLLVNIMVFQI